MGGRQAQKIRDFSRACDACRLSKIKCDHDISSVAGPSPCTNCRKRGASCAFELPMRKRGPRGRSRLSLSSNAPSSSIINASQPSPKTFENEISSNREDRSLREARPSLAQLHSINSTSIGGNAAAISTTTIEASPASLTPPSPSTSQSYRDPESALWQIWQRLLMDLSGGWNPEVLIGRCIDVYMVHLFSITPLIHEPSIRTIWSWAFGYGPLPPQQRVHSPVTQRFSTSTYDIPRVSGDKACTVNWPEAQALTLLTALCATCSFIIPETVLHNARTAALPFLHASRDILRLYLDRDIDRPSSNSVIIRYFHGISVHAAGNARTSWYLIGEAMRLAQELRLYDENALVTPDVVETSLRRAIFWQLYTGDQSAAILNSRPLTLHHRMLDMAPSTRHLSDSDINLLCSDRHPPEFARQITTGFNLCLTIWSLATDILLDLKLLEEFSSRSTTSADLVRGLTASIVDSALAFHTALDDMPDCLQHPGHTMPSTRAGAGGEDVEVSRKQQHISFWAQHVNLRVSYGCLRLFLLQKATDLGFASLLGFSEESRLLAMQKTEIAREVLACIQAAPFEALQVNGEPCVEKIRQVGASLLQVSQGPEPRIAARAKADFQILLNLLARLDSKASDALYRDIGSA